MAYIYDLTDTWNAGGTTFNAIKMNVTDSASAAGSKLVTLQTNGTEHFSVTKAGVGYFSGNVGIGTTSPGAKLDVTGAIYASTGVRSTAAHPISVYTGTADAQRMEILTSGTDGVLRATRSSGTIPNMLFRIDSNEAMRITSAGNVGIGTSAPGAKLALSTSTNDGILIDAPMSIAAYAEVRARYTGQNNCQSAIRFYNPDNGYGGAFTIWTQPESNGAAMVERMRIDASGNVGIGTSSPGTKLEVSSALDEVLRVTSSGSPYISWYAGVSRRGYIQAQTGSFSVASDTAIPLIFATNATERMRIDSSGNLLVGTTVEPSGVGTSGVMVQDLSGTAGRIFLGKTASGSVDALANYHNGTYVGGVVYSNTATSFPTSSDARLKHDIIDAPEASTLIDQIKVRSFKWNADDSEQRYGFVAQELVEVAPEAVSQPKDPEQMMGVDYSKLVPMLVKEIQSLRARVAQLEGN